MNYRSQTLRRRVLPLVLIVCLGGLATAAEMQRKDVADLIAEKNELREEVRRLNATTANLEDALRLLQNQVMAQDKRINSLQSSVASLKEDIASAQVKTASTYATQEQAKALESSLKKLSADWDSDKKVLTKAMSVVESQVGEIQNVAERALEYASKRPASTSTVSAAPAPSGPPKEFKGIEHKIQQGQYLYTIIKEFNAAIKQRGMNGSIGLKDVMEANPGLDPNRMQVGSIIRLPFPE